MEVKASFVMMKHDVAHSGPRLRLNSDEISTFVHIEHSRIKLGRVSRGLRVKVKTKPLQGAGVQKRRDIEIIHGSSLQSVLLDLSSKSIYEREK